jgi:hypothetical protein
MKRYPNPSNDNLDRLLDEHLSGTAEQLEPSSGFVLSVMESIQAQVAEPPPIPFPWGRALPVMLLVLCSLAGLVSLVLRAGGSGAATAPAHSQTTLSVLHSFVASAQLITGSEATLCWIVVAGCLSVAAIAASFRLTGRSN